jgi:hypothetical protein
VLRQFVRHHPYLNWLIVILTLGCHGFIWSFILMRCANQLCGEPRIPVKPLVKAFLAFTALYLVAFFAENTVIDEAVKAHSYHFPLILLVAVVIAGTGMVAIVCYGLVQVAEILRETGMKRLPSPFVTVVLTLAYLISLPLLQHLMTKAERAQSPTPASPSS